MPESTGGSLARQAVAALLLGLGLGIAISSWDRAAVVVSWIEPVGTIWIDALRMTILPLIAAGMIAGIADTGDPGAVGRIGGRALLLFLALLSGAALLALIAAPPLLSVLSVDPSAAAALRQAASGGGVDYRAAAQELPGVRQWLVSLIPTNAVAAASRGDILPLIVFSLGTGLALSRLAGPPRDMLVRFSRGITNAMLQLLRWILELAPIGIFALALALGSRMGLAALGAVLFYVSLVAGLCLLLIAAAYPLARLLAQLPVGRFARATAPAQAVAFSSRSSLASLPVLIDSGRRELGFSEQTTNFLLPLCASVFRPGGALGLPVGVIFLARIYGIDLSTTQLITIGATAVITTFSAPGIPNGGVLVMIPLLVAAGLPPEGVGILLGVDILPDMFRTVANVTGDMLVGAVVDGRERLRSPLQTPALDASVPASSKHRAPLDPASKSST